MKRIVASALPALVAAASTASEWSLIAYSHTSTCGGRPCSASPMSDAHSELVPPWESEVRTKRPSARPAAGSAAPTARLSAATNSASRVALTPVPPAPAAAAAVDDVPRPLATSSRCAARARRSALRGGESDALGEGAEEDGAPSSEAESEAARARAGGRGARTYRADTRAGTPSASVASSDQTQTSNNDDRCESDADNRPQFCAAQGSQNAFNQRARAPTGTCPRCRTSRARADSFVHLLALEADPCSKQVISEAWRRRPSWRMSTCTAPALRLQWRREAGGRRADAHPPRPEGGWRRGVGPEGGRRRGVGAECSVGIRRSVDEPPHRRRPAHPDVRLGGRDRRARGRRPSSA